MAEIVEDRGPLSILLKFTLWTLCQKLIWDTTTIIIIIVVVVVVVVVVIFIVVMMIIIIVIIIFIIKGSTGSRK